MGKKFRFSFLFNLKLLSITDTQHFQRTFIENRLLQVKYTFPFSRCFFFSLKKDEPERKVETENFG